MLSRDWVAAQSHEKVKLAVVLPSSIGPSGREFVLATFGNA